MNAARIEVMTPNHRTFGDRLDASEWTRLVMAFWFVTQHKCIAQVRPMIKAPSAAVWQDYVDGGDIFLQLPGQKSWLRVETKGRSRDYHFDRKWPYPDFLVCRQDAFDRADPKPSAIVHVDADCEHAAFVWSEDSHLWVARKNSDRAYGPGHEEMTYFAPVNSVAFRPLWPNGKPGGFPNART